MSHLLQDKYSSVVLAKLQKELVLKDGVVFNNDYEGDPTAGAVKVPQRDADPTVSDYNTASGLNISAGSTAYLTISINKDKAINEVIDGFEASAVPDGSVADRLLAGGYALAKQEDTDGGAELVSGGTAVNVSGLSSANIYDNIVDVRTKMSKANVPSDGRYILVTPDALALLIKSDEFISASNLGDEVKQNGIIGRIAGFNVIEWNDTTANLAMIAGHPKYATRVRAWKVPVHIQDINGSGQFIGASAVQGREVYGHKVTRATAIYCVYSPTNIAVTGTALTGDDAGKYQCTAVATASGTLKYKVITNGVLTPYGTGDTGFTSFTSGTTKITASSGNIIEIAEFNGDSKLIASGHYTVS